MKIQLFMLALYFFTDTFQALIEYSDPIAAQTSKVVSVQLLSIISD